MLLIYINKGQRTKECFYSQINENGGMKYCSFQFIDQPNEHYEKPNRYQDRNQLSFNLLSLLYYL